MSKGSAALTDESKPKRRWLRRPPPQPWPAQPDAREASPLGEDARLVQDTIYAEYMALPLVQRNSAYWVMAPDMWNFIRAIRTSEGGYLYVPGHGADPELLGLPIELRPGAEGVRLEY
jgi:hypothetical protein